MPDEVIYVTESSGFGGAEKYLLDLTAAAKSRTMKVSAALPVSPYNSELRQRLEQQGVTLLPVSQRAANYPLNLANALSFFRANSKATYHFSLPQSDCCRWLLLAACLLKARFFITEHSVPADPFKESLYFAATHALFNPLKKMSYSQAERVVAVSGGNKEILIERYGMPADKLEVIYNGINCSSFHTQSSKLRKLRQEFEIPDEALVLCNIGRFDILKGQIHLIHAFERLLARNDSLRLLLVGDGPLRAELEGAVYSKKMEGQVIFTGFRPDIPDILGLSDIFILPSLREGFAFTVLEAMAAGKPVVATRVAGTAEAIRDGETGFLCNVADPGDLAEKVEMLLADKAARERMGNKGRELVVREFDLKRMIEKTLALYQRPLS